MQLSNLSISYKIDTNQSKVGSEVFALGFPFALGIMGKEIKYTDGKISSLSGFKGDVTTYQTTVPIQAGNRGGPLFNINGDLIGLNSSILSHDITDNVSYAIKSIYLDALLQTISEYEVNKKVKEISDLSNIEMIKELSNCVALIKVK